MNASLCNSIAWALVALVVAVTCDGALHWFAWGLFAGSAGHALNDQLWKAVGSEEDANPFDLDEGDEKGGAR